MTYAMPADITLLDRNRDGLIDRAYAADAGGNIWRVDFEPTLGNAQSNWQVTKFAALGGTGSTKRKLLFPPDDVSTKTFDAVLTGTDDREQPLFIHTATLNVVNRFYMIKDTVT